MVQQVSLVRRLCCCCSVAFEKKGSDAPGPPYLTLVLEPPTVLAGALLESASGLLDRGIHPIKIADGFERACAVAVKELDRVGDVIEFSKDDTKELLKVAQTSMGSKMYAVRFYGRGGGAPS